MKLHVVIEGKEFPIQYEHADSYELVDFAPDGEEARYLVFKDDCILGKDGNIHADDFQIDAKY